MPFLTLLNVFLFGQNISNVCWFLDADVLCNSGILNIDVIDIINVLLLFICDPLRAFDLDSYL